MKDERDRRSTVRPTVELGIAKKRVPVHSHVACLWSSEREFEQAVGFVEAGLQAGDRCVVVGDENETATVLAVLSRKGFDAGTLVAEKRLVLARPLPSAREMLDRTSALFEALSAGAPLVRLFRNVGWGRETWPADAELAELEARLNEVADRFDCVLLCLHELPATTGPILRHGVLGTHPMMLDEGEVLANPLFVPLDEIPERLSAVASDLSTQQKRLKEVRREAEILQAIFDNIPVMISFRNSEGELLLANREWERVLGWTLQDAQHVDVLTELFPDSESRHEVVEGIRRADHRWSSFRVRTRDGRMVETSGSIVGLSDGTRLGFGLDVTERKRLEDRLKRSEAYLSEGEKLSHTGSWAWNVHSGEVFWSLGSRQIMGLDAATESSYEAALARLHPSDRERIRGEVDLARSERRGFDVHFRVPVPGGPARNVHSRGQPVLSETGEILEYVGVLMDVTERRIAEERLTQSAEELRALSERLRIVREEERTRMAREVHDEVGQALTALRMDVAWMERRLAAGEGERAGLEAKLAAMSELIDTTLDAVQRIATELRPGVLDELGLEAAIEWYVREFGGRTGIVCGFHSELDGSVPDSGRSTAVFRILQEALTNVARHSGATEARIELSSDGDRLRLEIQDNGRGIPENRLESSGSLGLVGMRERARALGGDVQIRGAPLRGTTVTLMIPL